MTPRPHTRAVCTSARRIGASQWPTARCLQPSVQRQRWLSQTSRRRTTLAAAASSAAAELFAALQVAPLRDVAATVVTGGGAFAWVKLFNWFAAKEVFDRVRPSDDPLAAQRCKPCPCRCDARSLMTGRIAFVRLLQSSDPCMTPAAHVVHRSSAGSSCTSRPAHCTSPCGLSSARSRTRGTARPSSAFSTPSGAADPCLLCCRRPCGFTPRDVTHCWCMHCALNATAAKEHNQRFFICCAG